MESDPIRLLAEENNWNILQNSMFGSGLLRCALPRQDDAAQVQRGYGISLVDKQLTFLFRTINVTPQPYLAKSCADAEHQLTEWLYPEENVYKYDWRAWPPPI
jgi:hypothetical protein